MNQLTGTIIESCIKIHSTIGPGCFERVYEEILHHEIQKRNIPIQRQLLMPIYFEDLQINDAYKLDLLVDGRLIIEIKSVENVLALHYKQLQTYLKLMKIKNGLLLNFKVDLMKNGVHRVFNNLGQ
ncbi:GxxExxY protein [Paraflavitalea speifideaquila]|uniref:GxxExxY protein n=1 Tax=Paraflavitalea speifideaquila TaxID=3076558 RepID=UPI0028EE6913|nr:GxxExxY protein [Paraflavitalea speifideiaquila]